MEQGGYGAAPVVPKRYVHAAQQGKPEDDRTVATIGPGWRLETGATRVQDMQGLVRGPRT